MASCLEKIQECPILGFPTDLCLDGAQPTKRQVLLYYEFLRYKELQKLKHNPSRASIIQLVSTKLVEHCTQDPSNPNLLSERQIKRLIDSLLSEYSALIKAHQKKDRPKNHENNLRDFLIRCDAVFDIQICKCKQSKCRCKPFHHRNTTDKKQETSGKILNY